jgi:hypothetical protein
VDRRAPGFRGLTQRMRGIRWPPEYERPDHPGWLLMRAILSRWIRESNSLAVLCPIPTFDHILGNIGAGGYQARFAELAADLGVQLIDLLPALHRHPQDVRRRMRFVHDEHPTALGHELIAAAIAPYLSRFASKEGAA